MSILRKQSRAGWTTIDNSILESELLSWRAKGLACYLISKPNDWVIRMPHIVHIGKEGEKAVRTALQELATAGYLMRRRERDDKGHLHTVTFIADYPAFIDEGTAEERINGYSKTDTSETDIPFSDRSEMGNSLLSTDTPNTDIEDISFSDEKGTPEEKTTTPTPPVTPRKPRPKATPPAPAPESAPTLSLHQQMFGALCTLIGWDYKTLTKDQAGQVAQALGVLEQSNYTIENLRSFYLYWRNSDWRGKKGQYPTLSQVRSEIGKVKPDIANGNGVAPEAMTYTVVKGEESLWDA